jgi:hypothetical protein
VDSEEECVEDIFDQLWAVSLSDRVRVLEVTRGHGCLVWVRKELVAVGKVQIEDCFPVNQNQRIEGELVRLSFTRDIC